nr:hypothetical protein pPsy0462b_00100 [Pseudomonas syringae]
MLGVWFALQGMLSWKRSFKDGHTGLSASQDVSSGTLKFILGVFCVCSPYLLSALQSLSACCKRGGNPTRQGAPSIVTSN